MREYPKIYKAQMVELTFLKSQIIQNNYTIPENFWSLTFSAHALLKSLVLGTSTVAMFRTKPEKILSRFSIRVAFLQSANRQYYENNCGGPFQWLSATETKTMTGHCGT